MIEKPSFVRKVDHSDTVYHSDEESYKSTTPSEVPDGEEMIEDYSVTFSNHVSTQEAKKVD